MRTPDLPNRLRSSTVLRPAAPSERDLTVELGSFPSTDDEVMIAEFDAEPSS
jgi:hypothetical protein